MRIAIAQINTTVGDIAGNIRKIREYARQAQEQSADLVLFPELTVAGYPPEDLLLKPGFIRKNRAALEELAAELNGITTVVGFADNADGRVYNAAGVIADGAVNAVVHKTHLPNYGVFDEKRYFEPSVRPPAVVQIAGVTTGITICEDIWIDPGPAGVQAGELGARLILVLNASPYHAGKVREREDVIRQQARRTRCYIAYCNLIGGQDELVFDGFSMVVDPDGEIIARAGGFTEALVCVDIPLGEKKKLPALDRTPCRIPGRAEEVYQALVLGVRDYVEKNGFNDVVIGLSGGIDSAIVAALAVDALGRDRVHGVFMPTRYSSDESRDDATQLALNLGIDLRTIAIDDLFSSYLNMLAPHFCGKTPDLTEENLQARIRGTIIMALSNKFSWLVLTTGNKSEMSTGYATLYGDMAGGFAVIKDVPKVLVYELCEWRNTGNEIIPRRIITKAPTAELRPDQKDSDSLPVYPVLDPILKMYVEDDRSATEIIAAGFAPEIVYKVVNLVDKSEYKRRQSPPGIKITPRAFGRDRRMPITNRFREN